MSSEEYRVSLKVDQSLKDRLEEMPRGIRSEVIRQLLTRVMDRAEQRGGVVYGAIINGDFDIVLEERG